MYLYSDPKGRAGRGEIKALEEQRATQKGAEKAKTTRKINALRKKSAPAAPKA